MPGKLTLILLAVTAGETANVFTIHEEPLFAIAVASLVVCALCAGFQYGSNRTTKLYEDAISPLPKDITFSRSEDGRLTAFLTTIGGDLQVLEVPADVAAGGPSAALKWVIQQTAPD